MSASMLLSTLSRTGRATASRVGRSVLMPCRVGLRITRTLQRRRRAERVAEVDWFDDIEPDELAG